MNQTTTSSIKIISPTIHGIIDYAVVIFLLLAPSLFSGLAGTFALASYALGVIHLALTVSTRFPAGLFGVISFRLHGFIELIVAIALIISPWVLGYSDVSVARNFYLLFGVGVFAIWFLTDYVPASSRVKEANQKKTNQGQNNQQRNNASQN